MPPSAAPPSLKGITSTNDDPNLCAVCCTSLPRGAYTNTSAVVFCCGKRTCLDCHDSELIFEVAGSGADRCSFCKRPDIDSGAIGALKKHAKKGAPWAQFYLGMSFSVGRLVANSEFDAVRWLRKAAAQGHPDAHRRLCRQYLGGDGCSRDLLKARKHAEEAMFLDANLVDEARLALTCVGGGFINEGDVEEAKLILMPLAEAGITRAQHNVGVAFFNDDDALDAEQWFVSAALQANGLVESAYHAMLCCEMLGKFAQSRYWLGITTKRMDEFHAEIIEQRTAGMEQTWADFRKLRDTCGGCGMALDGKMRKICKQCKAFCYCSRECQKLHWNFQGEFGHRDDCMGVLDLKERMKNVRAAEKK